MRRLWYFTEMAQQARNNKRPSRHEARRLGSKAFAAITAVEGLALSNAGRRRLADMKARKLSPDRQRAEVLKAYAATKGR